MYRKLPSKPWAASSLIIKKKQDNKQTHFNYAKLSTEKSIKKLETMYKEPNYKIIKFIVDDANDDNNKQYLVEKWHTNIFNTMAFSFSFYLVYLFYKRQ
jgi:hypothetical protein